MMNNFTKVYTAETLKKNKIVTLVALPMEESIMVPVSQMIDLMKQGENVIFFSFNHDSIKVSNFLQEALKREPNPENIKGMNAVIDAHQITPGMNWIDFVKTTIAEVRRDLTVNYVFLDVIPFVTLSGGDESLVYAAAQTLSFTDNITPIVLKTLDGVNVTSVQKQNDMKKQAEEFISQDLFESLGKASNALDKSDLVLGIQRERNNFWKKIINFLLFWRKRNNFTLRVLKNRNGENKSYRMNLDMENFKTEVF